MKRRLTAGAVAARHCAVSSLTTSSAPSSSVLGVGTATRWGEGRLLRRGYAGSFTRKKDKKKKKGDEAEGSEGLRFDEELWKLRPQWVTLTRTPEQLKEEEELVKAYCRLKMDRNKREHAAMSKMLKLKLAALNELPPDLRAAALVEDVSPPPRERVIPLWTAPIPDYQESLPPEKRDEPFDFTKLGSIRKRT